MYRVGFGDFFLLTVPSGAEGELHILIDCGVHAGNLGSIGDCVADLVSVTQRKLALVIVTHYHADHLSGFATQSAEFEQFEVGAVWITNRLDPGDAHYVAQKQQAVAVASQLRIQLQARLALEPDDARAAALSQAMDKANNALGVAGGQNDEAMELVTKGFKNRPPVYYYGAGDTPFLPAALQGVLTAEILSPSPKASAGEFNASDDKAEQYLAAVATAGLPDPGAFSPFDRTWPAGADDYPREAFRPWSSAAAMEDDLQRMQPDAMEAAADALDGTLNNQSLVVLFECKGKKLLFVGDAQWGNWASWLYGKGVTGKDPGISARAKGILGSIDFYKVGHHGSTNATPVPVVAALAEGCLAMCSTETGYPSDKRTYGNIEKKTEVPRLALMDALEARTGKKLVRSDWIAVGQDHQASPEARTELPKLPQNFVAGPLYIDCFFPS